MKNISKPALETKLTNLNRRPSAKNGKGRLKTTVVKELLKQLRGKWQLKGGRQIQRTFKFRDFREALRSRIGWGKIAEKQNHYPDIYLTYGEVRLHLSTHMAKGLTANDFILAAKIDGLK